jgi:hypothetical protein
MILQEANAVSWARLETHDDSSKNRFRCSRCRATAPVVSGIGVSEQHDLFAIEHKSCLQRKWRRK